MEDEKLINELLNLVELQEKLIQSLKNRISDLSELNQLLELKSDLSEKLLKMEEQKLPVINYN
jgi:iron-sulfur cluster repair protein YtfE (RIC family)